VECRLIGRGRGEGLLQTVSNECELRCQETNIVVDILTTNVEHDLRKVGCRELERKVRGPQGRTEAIANTGETTTRCCVGLEHDKRLVKPSGDSARLPIWVDHGHRRVSRVGMPQEVGIYRLRLEDVAVDLAVVGRVVLDRQDFERVLEALDEAGVEQIGLVPETTRRGGEEDIPVRKGRRGIELIDRLLEFGHVIVKGVRLLRTLLVAIIPASELRC
jgi:hypothetical protein